jgi:SAM-dependent methyltransferase
MSLRLVRPFGLLDYFLTSVRVGITALPGPYAREAVARIVNPLSYPRYLEYELALSKLGPLEGCRVLDIGSPKLPVLLLARHANCELFATDIRDYFIGSTRYFLNRMGLSGRIGKDLHLQVQDARGLTYADSFFDKIYAISVVEHIPADGDADAMREIGRVLRPGGVATLTVPFRADGYQDEFINGVVFERDGDGSPTFYQRRYDVEALRTRLVEPSGLVLTDTTYFGEPRVRFEAVWNRIPMRWKVPLLWAQPFLAKLFLKPVGLDRLDAAVGVALRLEKPLAHQGPAV